jgi:hypothetical protein
MRVAEDGSVWVGEGGTLTRYGENGRTQAVVDVPVEPGEEVGGFLLVPDGFAAALYQPVSRTSGKVRGRVARLDAAGGVVWSTALPASSLAYAGVVEMGVDSGWQPRPKKAWLPEDWRPAIHGEPLLLS